MLIRTGEGTADAGGYSRLFGGGSFNELTDHPRQAVTRSGLTSTAAGAYQILARTWDDLRNNGVDLPDFTPDNQDKAAVALIKRRGALADVLAGRFDKAIAKTNKEWASLPGSPYGQPTLSLSRARSVLLSFGGQFDSTGGILV
jgi:lysozyme